MKAHDIKQQVSIERVVAHYGGTLNAKGEGRCLFADRHEHGDADPSMRVHNGYVKCWSQGCFGEKGADIFGLVGVVENLPGFKEQRKRVMELFRLNGKQEPRRTILRSYRWTDEDGHEAYKLRLDTEKPGDKCIWAEDPEGRRLGKGACRPTLRGLSGIQAASTVIVCEGESDQDTVNDYLQDLSLLGEWFATTTAHGASDVKPDYLARLHGKARVVVSGDNDAAGQGYLNKCGQALHGKVGELLTLRVPDGHKDWRAWKETGRTAEQFKALLAATTPWSPSIEPAQQPAEDSDYHITDLGNAKRLVVRHGQDLQHCHELGWLTFTGIRWELDPSAVVVGRMAEETVKAMYVEAASLSDKTERAALAHHALKTESEQRIQAMLAAARRGPGVPVKIDQLDADPWLLCCANGAVDLRTGDLRPHRREDLITRLTPIAYDRHAGCPAWEKFLSQVLVDEQRQPDQLLIQYIQKAIGYSLTGITRERQFFLLYGTGHNGKSTFLSIGQSLLGDYAQGTAMGTFLAKHGSQIPNDLARLKGARFVIAVEATDDRRWDEELLKKLTGGEDTVSARFMRREWFDFKPACKLWFAVNHRPTVRGTDPAIWGRIRLVPFRRVFEEKDQDTTLADKLRLELPGILAWAVRGCLAWQEEKTLIQPDAVKKATQEYRNQMDVFADFLHECCVEEQEARITVKELYASYTKWCEESLEKPMTKKKFGMTMDERGVQQKPAKVDGKVASCRFGLRLRTEMDVDDEAPAAPSPTEPVAAKDLYSEEVDYRAG